MYPTYFAILVLGCALFAGERAMIRWAVVLCVFGGSAAIVVTALGRANVTPASLFLPFLAARAFLGRGARAQAPFRLSARDPALWLALFLVWAIVLTALAPKLLVGEVMIRSVERDSGSQAAAMIPLKHIASNLTQTVYAIGAFVLFVSARVLLQRQGDRDLFRSSVVWLSVIHCSFALVNLVSLYAGLPDLLSLVRNGEYLIYHGGEIGGLKRLTGTFPEASMFAAFTLPLLAFNFHLWLSGVKPRLHGTLALCLAVLLMLATSSTGYAGLLAFLGLFMGWRSMRALFNLRPPHIHVGLVVCIALMGSVGLLIVMLTGVVQHVVDFFDITLVSKLDSASARTRFALNEQAWGNFIDTFGLGVGLGSTRASSFLLVLLSNLGAIGALLYSAFLLSIWRCSATAGEECESLVARASGAAMLAALIAASISTSVFELGPLFYLFAAGASMVWWQQHSAQSVSAMKPASPATVGWRYRSSSVAGPTRPAGRERVK